MTANATHPGRITIPGTDLGVRGTLIAEPQTENMLLSLDDRLALGPVKVDTDATGVLESPGLVVPIVSSVLWLLRFEPHNNAVPTFTLGIYNLNTSGVDLKDLVDITITAVDSTATPGDAAVASFLGDPSSATRIATDARYGLKPDNAARSVGKGELVFNVADYATPSAAVAAAGVAGGTVYFPAGVWNAATVLSLASGVTLRGDPGAILRAAPATTMPRIISCASGASNIAIRGLTIDAAGLVTSEIMVTNNNIRVTVEDNAFTDTAVATRAVLVNPSSGDSDSITIQRNRFDGCATAIAAQAIASAGVCNNLTISNNRIKNWTQRGIYVTGTTVSYCTNLRVEGNKITDLAGAGSSRYPIRIQATDTNPHLNVTVVGNYVKGPGTAYNGGAGTGTADQISVAQVDGLVVSNNTSVDGGDCGITVETQCRNVTITGNVIKRQWNCSLALGGTISTTYQHNVTVTGNTFVDINLGSLSAGIGGIRAQNCQGAMISGNMFASESTSGADYLYAVSLKNCADFTVGPNSMRNLAPGALMVYSETGNTNLATISAAGALAPASVLGTAASVSNTAADTTLFTAATIGAASLTAGQTILRVRVYGNMDSIATPGTFNLRVKANGTIVAGVGLLTTTASSTNTATPWSVDYDLIVDTLGASGAVSTFGRLSGVTGSTNTRLITEVSNVGTVVNLTSGLTISVSANTATANAGNIIRALRGSVQQIA